MESTVCDAPQQVMSLFMVGATTSRTAIQAVIHIYAIGGINVIASIGLTSNIQTSLSPTRYGLNTEFTPALKMAS
jgi:hypothetical protein